MTWVKLDDKFFQHRKIRDLSTEAICLHLAGLCYSNQFLTDGLIHSNIIPTLLKRNSNRALTSLEVNSIWLRLGSGDYQIVNYLEYQTSKADVEKVKQSTKNRVEAHRKRKAGNADVTPLQNGRNGDVTHSEPEPETEPETEIKKKIKVIKDDQSIEDPDFKVFWAAYPKKVKKQNALKSYIKALKVATPQEIFEGMIRYSRTCGDDLKFVANPDGWLNQMRWQDVYEVPAITPRQNQSSPVFGGIETSQPPRITKDEFAKLELTPEQLTNRQKIIDEAKANAKGNRVSA